MKLSSPCMFKASGCGKERGDRLRARSQAQPKASIYHEETPARIQEFLSELDPSRLLGEGLFDKKGQNVFYLTVCYFLICNFHVTLNIWA